MVKNNSLKIVGIISIIIGFFVTLLSIIFNFENISIANSMTEVYSQSAELVVSLILVIILGAISGVVCAISGITCIIQKNKTVCIALSIVSLIISIASAIFFMIEEMEIILLIPVIIISIVSSVMSFITKKQ